MSRRKLLVADLLCGAGGSSTGCERALRELGLQMELVCLNHWQTAIDTHTLNHPTARHYVQDIATVRPHLIVPEGYLDLLMASPTCTHHSVARGGKPTSDQQRSDPWHIITWLTELRVKRIIIENVWEFTAAEERDALKAELAPYRRQAERIGTHADGCGSWGPGHYWCLLRERDALAKRVEGLETAASAAINGISGYKTPSAVVRAVLDGHIPPGDVPASFDAIRLAKRQLEAALQPPTESQADDSEK